jgi:hypothetical protein
MVETERRAVVAAVVSLVGAVIGIGGAGHAYLREWGRAFAWFSLVLGAGLVLVGSFTNPETATLATLPLNTVDAYFIARRDGNGGVSTVGTESAESTVSCPSCGQDLDPELSFCPWCAGSRDGEE